MTAGTRQTTVGAGGGGLGGGGVGGSGAGGGPTAANVAVALWAAFITRTHVADCPAQSPVQPAKLKPEVGVAVSETEAPSRKLAEHAAPQFMPTGALVTWPFGAPTVRFRVVTFMNAAPLAPRPSVAITVTRWVPGVA